jgi:uncharacterized protein YbcI
VIPSDANGSVPTVESAQRSATSGETLARISTGLVQLHSRYYGKGPTKAKTHMVNDTVISILRGGSTTVERTLIDQGNVEAVYSVRRSFQMAMEEHFTAVVEDATDRKVVAYMSQIHESPDLAVEIFVLEPLGARSQWTVWRSFPKSVKVAPCLRSARTRRRQFGASSARRACQRVPGCGSRAR